MHGDSHERTDSKCTKRKSVKQPKLDFLNAIQIKQAKMQNSGFWPLHTSNADSDSTSERHIANLFTHDQKKASRLIMGDISRYGIHAKSSQSKNSDPGDSVCLKVKVWTQFNDCYGARPLCLCEFPGAWGGRSKRGFSAE